MNVFVSWSGDASRDLGRILSNWLPLVIPGLKPWMSEDDIAKGVPWREVLFEKLASTAQGIVCITPDNANEPWLNFEAGSLAKAVQDKTYVWTLLLNVTKSEVTGPLASFQATLVHDRDDFFRLVKSLNDEVSDPHPPERLKTVFDRWWPDLVDEVARIPRPQSAAGAPKRSEREILEEILTLVRALPQIGPAPGRSADWPRLPRVSALPDEREAEGGVDEGLR